MSCRSLGGGVGVFFLFSVFLGLGFRFSCFFLEFRGGAHEELLGASVIGLPCQLPLFCFSVPQGLLGCFGGWEKWQPSPSRGNENADNYPVLAVTLKEQRHGGGTPIGPL
jgi:hypothetical protein